MAGDEPKRGDPAEQRLLRRLRVLCIVVLLSMVVLLVLVDTFGRLFISPTFHVDELLAGTLIGALLLLLGVEGAARWPWRNSV